MTTPKNILFLMTDQQRPDYVGYQPRSRVSTPNIDRIAQGMAFDRCLSVNPICTPARSSLLTGKYSHQIGMLSMSGDLSQQHPTYPRALQQAGYWTAGIGKFHWLQGWPWNTPRGHGFDLVALEQQIRGYGFDHVWEASGKQLALKDYCHYARHLDERGLLEAFRDHVASRGGNFLYARDVQFTGEPWPFDESDYVDIVTADHVISAIQDRPADRPFFIFGSFCSPHAPYDPPARYLDQIPDDDTDDFVTAGEPMSDELKQRWFRLRRSYRAMIRCVDDQVGRVLDALEAEGLLDETVVIFTSDHGEMLGDRGLQQKRWPWWQSCTVPLAIRHPDYLRGAHHDGCVELTDITATILDVAGLDAHEALSKPWPEFHDRVPCRSILPVLRGDADRVREAAFSESSGIWQMIETRRWKLVRWLEGNPLVTPGDQLFDLDADPQSLHDRAGDDACRSALAHCQSLLQRVLDTTPPAQLQWATFGPRPSAVDVDL